MGMIGVLAILAVLPACAPLNGFSVVYESPELDLASIPESSILVVLPQEGPDISRLRLEQGDPRNVVEEMENRVKERRWFCARDRARAQEGVRNEATLDSGDDWQRPDGCHVAL